MKQFSILNGKAHVVELPEGASNPRIEGQHLTYNISHDDEWGYDYNAERLPQGNWRIIGMLSEVTEEQAASIAEQVRVMNQPTKGYRTYNVDQYGNEGYFESAIKSLESAILAEGHTFTNPYGSTAPDAVIEGNSFDYLLWHEAQSRVLFRERCLVLRRTDG